MSKSQASPEIMDYVSSEIEKTVFGEVRIELSGNKNAVDVVTTYRKRFPKPGQQEEGKNYRETEFHKG